MTERRKEKREGGSFWHPAQATALDQSRSASGAGSPLGGVDGSGNQWTQAGNPRLAGLWFWVGLAGTRHGMGGGDASGGGLSGSPERGAGLVAASAPGGTPSTSPRSPDSPPPGDLQRDPGCGSGAPKTRSRGGTTSEMGFGIADEHCWWPRGQLGPPHSSFYKAVGVGGYQGEDTL